MKEIDNVVTALQQKSKGKLQYDRNWSPNNLLQSNFTVPSFESSTELYEEYPSINSYENYYSPERVVTNKISENNKSVTVKPVTRKISGIIHDYDTISPQIDKDYDHMLELSSKKRLQKNNEMLSLFDLEFAETLEEIKNKSFNKLSIQKQQLQSEELLLQAEGSKEMKDFQKAIGENDVVSNDRERQIELHKAHFEAKRKQIEQQKQVKLQYSKNLHTLAESGKQIMAEVNSIYKECQDKGCDIPQNFKLLNSEISNRFLEFLAYIQEALNVNNGDLEHYNTQSKLKVEHMQNLKQQSIEFAKELQQKVLDESKAKEEEQKKIIEEQKKREEEEKEKLQKQQSINNVAVSTIVRNNSLPLSVSSKSISSTLPDNISISSSIPALAPLEGTLKSLLPSFTTKSAFITYLKLLKQQTDLEKHIEPLNKSSLKNKKAYKFELYKVVNTAVNALSDESPKHLLDKIMKLNSLLSNEDVQVGNKSISAKLDPLALPLCKDLLAKKLVLQGVSQVSSSFKTAFPIAAVCIGMWSLFPDCGELILAHFYKRCPYLVPFYVPKTNDITTEQYYSLLGYDVEGTTIEEEDAYVKKLSGLVRLYAAIIISDIPPQLGSRQHPHGIDNGWIWFTSLLNLEPQPVVTATIIYDFLEVVGYAMMKKFGSQFRKLLFFICNSYLPKILKVTPANSKSSASRLQLFLEECIKDGKIKPPDGALTMAWWKS